MSSRAFTLTPAEQQRIDRLDQLVAVGGDGVTELVAAVADPSWTVRRAAVAGLAALGDEAVPALVEWLEHARTTEHEIAAVVDALSTSIGTTATPVAIALLTHPVAAVAADAASILGRRHAVEATAELAAQLGHADDNVAVAAIEALGALSPTSTPAGAIEPLIAVVQARSFFRTFPALQVLARSADPRVVQPIAALVGDPLFQLEAIRALGRTGSAFAIAPLVAALGGAVGELVRTIAIALADLIARAEWSGAGAQITQALRPALAPSLNQLALAIAGASSAERAAIAAVLGRTGDPSVLHVLVELLDDDAVRPLAIAGIKALGHELPLLAGIDGDTELELAILPLVSSSRDTANVRARLDHADPEIRARACEALARLGDTTVVPALFELLSDRNPRVALAAAGAIQSLQTAETAPRLLAALAGGTPAVKRQSLRIVAYLGIANAFEATLAATSDPDRRVAELAIAALGMLADPRVDPVLEILAQSPEAVLRAAAMRAWGHRGSVRTAGVLEAGLADADAWVRYYAAQALGKIGHAASTPLLLARLADEMPHVRVAALEALARFDAPSAWDALVAAVHSSDPDECRAALVGLGQRPRAAALPILLEAARSPDLATRLIAISGLASQPGSEALAELTRALRDPDLAIADAALSLLAEREDPAAIAALIDTALATELTHPIHAALSRATPVRITALATALTSAESHAATVLAAALGRMADHRATAALFDALASGSPAARGASASILVAMNADGARDAVTRLANEDLDPEVRRIGAALVRAGT